MKRAYSPQARTRSSPKLIRYGVASVKPTALKQLVESAGDHLYYSTVLQRNQSDGAGARTEACGERCPPVGSRSDVACLSHRARVKPSWNRTEDLRCQSLPRAHPNQRALMRTANLDAVAAAIRAGRCRAIDSSAMGRRSCPAARDHGKG